MKRGSVYLWRGFHFHLLVSAPRPVLPFMLGGALTLSSTLTGSFPARLFFVEKHGVSHISFNKSIKAGTMFSSSLNLALGLSFSQNQCSPRLL